MNNLIAWFVKNAKLAATFAVAASVLSFGSFWLGASVSKSGVGTPGVSRPASALEKELADLKIKNENLEADRNNVLAQTKNLLSERSRWQETQDAYVKLQDETKKLLNQKEKMLERIMHQKRENAALGTEWASLKARFAELEAHDRTVSAENVEVQGLLKKKVEAAPQYIKIYKQAQALDQENKNLKNQIKDLNGKLKQAQDRIRRIQGRDINFKKQIQTLKKSADELKAANASLTKTNQALNKVVEEGPKNFKDMAQQNKTLIKETAVMHYNMGVFFTQNKQFDMAVKEFMRALEFDPNNPKIHYNLGYIFSEEFQKHDRAMLHFNRYLELQPHSKEAEAVRSYMLMRQTYGDKIAKK